MDRRQRAVRRGGDDGRGFHFLAVRPGPGLPYTGKSERRAGFRMHVIRLLAAADRFPFVEAVGRDQAAPPFHRRPERRFLGHSFDPRVERRVVSRARDRPGVLVA